MPMRRLQSSNTPQLRAEPAPLGTAAFIPILSRNMSKPGKVKYVFRPFPAANPTIATTGHKLALCADRSKFYKNIDLQFDRQAQIYEMGAKPGGLRQAYISLAKSSGLSEEEFITCMSDPDVASRLEAFTQMGVDQGVTGTPTIFIDGKKATKNDLEGLESVILPLLGEPIPEKADTE